MNKYVPIFNYPLASFLVNEGWVVHHTSPNKNDPKRQVYYFNYCPGIYEDMNRFQNTKEANNMNTKTQVINGEPNYLVPIYDSKMVRYLSDLNFKIDHVEVYVSEVDDSKRRITYFKYQRGFYHGIQKYLNRQDKMNRKKINKGQHTQEED